MVPCGVIFSKVKLIFMGSFHAFGSGSWDLQYYIDDGSGPVHMACRLNSTSTEVRANIKDILLQIIMRYEYSLKLEAWPRS